MASGVIFNVYSISSAGIEFLDNPKKLTLPSMDLRSPTQVKDQPSKPVKCSRKGAGSQMLPVVRGLMCTAGNGLPSPPQRTSKNIWLSTLRDAKQNVDHRAYILDFEKEAVAFDSKQRKQASNDGEHLVEYDSLGHPYVRDYSLTSSLNWVLLMSPLMINMLSQSDFIEVDITYKASVEFEYLLNAVTFNYTTMRCKFDRTCT